jgi:hypothetical protein
MSQSKRASLVEAVVSTLVGVLVGLVAQWVFFPMYGIYTSYETDLWLVFWFTIVSFIRSYVMRRAWNSEWWKRTTWSTWVWTLEFLTLGAAATLALVAIHP